MKKTFGFFAVLTVFLLGFSSCQKEVNQVEKTVATHTLKFVANAPLTKTTADINQKDKTVDYNWTKDDEGRFTVYEIAGGTYSAATETIGTINDDGTMSILASFDGDYVTGAQYIALLNTGIQTSQKATGIAYDELSDVLVSEKISSDNIEDQVLNLRFKRETAFALMTAKGLTEGTKIIGASITSDQILAAEYNIEKEAFNEEGAKTINIFNDGEAISAIDGGNGNVFFATTPITDAHITVGVVTGDEEGKYVAAYEKKIADERSISFENGNVRPFNIGMNEVTEQTLNLTIDETTTASEDELSWDRTFVKVVAAKAGASTPANNYYPGTSGKSYTATRFYKNSTLTFTPKLGLSIKEIVYEATTDDYTSAIVNSSWTNATASAADKTVTIIPTDGTKAVSATIGATTGTTSITIKYGIPVQPTPHSVIVDPNIENGIVTANPSSDVMPGTEVALTATADENFVFASWNVTAGDEEIIVTDNKFSMPDADVVVSATFEEKQGDEVETSFVFDTDAGLTALGITKPGNSAGTNLGDKTYVSDAIEMKATDGGTATRVWNSSGATSLRVYKNGGSLTFSGATISKIVFTGSSLTKQTADTGSYSEGTWTGSASSVKFTANDGVTIKTITVTYVGGGPVVTKYDVNCSTVDGGTLSANPSKAEAGAEVTLTATPAGEEWSFNNDWSVVDAESNPVDVVSGKFTMPASNVTVTGSFTKKTYAITANTAEHGSYTVKVGDVAVTSASKGDKVTLSASPAEGYLCDGWTVKETDSGKDVSVSNNAFYMPAAAVTITTSFSEKPVMEYDHAGTEADPYSIQDVLKFIGTLGTGTSTDDVYAKGVISNITEINTLYGNATYNIKDANTEYEMTVYRGLYINGANFTSSNQIAEGDEVVVKGKVKDFKGTKEFDTGNQLVSIKKAPYLKATASKTSGIAAAGETISVTVETNVASWTVESSDPTNFAISGKTTNSFNVVVAENTDTQNDREATITVKAEGAEDAVFTLKQVKKGGSTGPAVGTVLWGENFAHFGTKTPSAAGTGTGTTIYGDATITYDQSSTNTKGYNEKTAGGTAPELLLSKSNQTWTISGIPCADVTNMSLTFLSNKTAFAVSSTTTGITVTGSQKSWTIKNSGATTFTLVIKNTSSKDNARIDNVELKVTAN